MIKYVRTSEKEKLDVFQIFKQKFYTCIQYELVFFSLSYHNHLQKIYILHELGKESELNRGWYS